MPEIKKTLQEFGLTENEAEVYLILLQLGYATASEIASKTQIHRVNIYDILERLQERGLVGFAISGKRKQYEAVNPKRILEIEECKKESLKKIIPRLEKLMQIGKSPQEATIYKDYSGIKSVIDEHTHSKTPVYLFSSGWGLKQNFPDYFEIYHGRLKKNKIKVKALLSNKFREVELPELYEIRFLPSEYTFPSSTVVYEDKTLIIMWNEQPLAILIRGKDVSDSYKHYFELLWKIAKK